MYSLKRAVDCFNSKHWCLVVGCLLFHTWKYQLLRSVLNYTRIFILLIHSQSSPILDSINISNPDGGIFIPWNIVACCYGTDFIFEPSLWGVALQSCFLSALVHWKVHLGVSDRPPSSPPAFFLFLCPLSFLEATLKLLCACFGSTKVSFMG